MVLITIDENEFEVNIAKDDLEDLKAFLNNYRIKKMPNIVKWYIIKAKNLKEKYRMKECEKRGVKYDPDNFVRKKRETKPKNIKFNNT